GGEARRGQIVAALDVSQDRARVVGARREHRVRHPDQRDERGVRRLVVAVWLVAEDPRGLPAVQEAAVDASINVDDATGRRAVMVVGVMAVARERGVGERRDEGGGGRLHHLGWVWAA